MNLSPAQYLLDSAWHRQEHDLEENKSQVFILGVNYSLHADINDKIHERILLKSTILAQCALL